MKIKNIEVLNSFMIASLLVVTLSSCGPNGSKNAGNNLSPVRAEPKGPEEQSEANASGVFLAVLETQNALVAEKVTGAATIFRDQDELVGDVRFSGGSLTARIMHVQSVHNGSRCPTALDDLNGDGFIDAVEGQAVYGKVLIPLDGDLNSQFLELGTYPVADDFGGYVYAKVASFGKFLKDLYEEDISPEDYLTKLRPEDLLSIRGRVVVIQGISPDAHLPLTVVSNSSLANFQTLPVACGVLSKIISTPGSVDHDNGTDPSTERPGGAAGNDDGVIIVPPEETVEPTT